MVADVRTAARTEAFNNRYSHKQVRDRYDADLLITGFIDGAVWGAALVTPTREQIAKRIFMTDYEHMGPEAWEAAKLDGNNDLNDAYTKADAVLALMTNKGENE